MVIWTPQMILWLILGLVIWAGASTAILIILWILLPRPAKTFLSARLKKGVSILGLIDSSGILDFKLVKADMAQGVLRSLNPGEYYFTPQFLKISDEDPDAERFNNLLRYRTIIKGLGKPFWLGCADTLIAANPKLVEAMEKAKSAEKEKRVIPVTFLSADTLREFVPLAWTPETISEVEKEWELYGRLGRPRRVISPGLLIGIIIVAFIVMLFVMGGGVQSLTVMLRGG